MLSFLIAAAMASPPVQVAPHTHPGPVQVALEAGEIERQEALWLSFLVHFDPEALPAAYAEQAPVPGFCRTPLVIEIQNNWEEFDNEKRLHMTRFLAPWKRDWADEEIQRPPPPPGMSASESCFNTDRPSYAGTAWEDPVAETMGTCSADGVSTEISCAEVDDCEDGTGVTWTCEGYDAGSEGYQPNHILTEHFSVEWDSADVSESVVQSWANALEKSWETQVDEMNWRRPDGSTSYLVLAYISEANYSGAFTGASQCGNVYMPYIVAGQGSFASGNWYLDMAAHEFNHASQYAYGQAHELWFWESTATWIQEYVYPTHDWWSPYVQGYTDNPHISMRATSQQDYDIFLHMYGMAIFNFYLDEYVGGADLVRGLWRYGQTHGEGFYDLFIGDAVDGENLDFSAIYDGFIATNAVMDYEAGIFPTVQREDSTGSLPAAGGNDGNDKPQGYGQNYIKISTSTVDESAPDLRLEFTGDSRQEWTVLLVGVTDDEVVQVQKLSLTDSEGSGVLRNYGNFDIVWLVVSPLNTSTQGRSYSWDLQAIDSDTFEDTGDPLDNEKPSAAACACSQGAPNGFGALPLLLLGLTLRRRRKVC